MAQKEEPVLAESTEAPSVLSEKKEDAIREEETHRDAATESQEAPSDQAAADAEKKEIPEEVEQQDAASDHKGAHT